MLEIGFARLGIAKHLCDHRRPLLLAAEDELAEEAVAAVDQRTHGRRRELLEQVSLGQDLGHGHELERLGRVVVARVVGEEWVQDVDFDGLRLGVVDGDVAVGAERRHLNVADQAVGRLDAGLELREQATSLLLAEALRDVDQRQLDRAVESLYDRVEERATRE